MKLDLNILLAILRIYLKVQMIICSRFRNIQVHVKISEHFLSQFLTFKFGLDLKLTRVRWFLYIAYLGLNISVKFEESPSISIELIERTRRIV
jgi:hypothetical protein